MTVTLEMTSLLLVWHSQYGQIHKESLILVRRWVWAVTLYQRWLPHSNKFGLSGYFRGQYYFSMLAKLHEQIAELPACEGCIVCHL